MEGLSVPILLGTAFIDQNLKVILPKDRKVVPKHSSPVTISRNSAKKAVYLSDQKGTTDPLVRVARKTTIQTVTQNQAFVVTDKEGLR